MEFALTEELIVHKIFFIRGQKVMLDRDLAELYDVETKVLKQAVKRNLQRFPPDFMFELSLSEWQNLRSHFVTSSWGGTRYTPVAFTEQGVSMLSSVLKSERAIQVNIEIIRIFTRLRQFLIDHAEIKLEIEKIKKKLDNHGKNIDLVFSYLDELLKQSETKPERKPIGFKSK